MYIVKMCTDRTLISTVTVIYTCIHLYAFNYLYKHKLVQQCSDIARKITESSLNYCHIDYYVSHRYTAGN